MAQSRYYSATAQPTTLASSITASQTSVPLVAATGFPATTPFILALDYNTPSEEIVLCTTLVGVNATVVRAYDGTSATSHNAGAGVRHTWSAIDGNDSRNHEASTIVHGVTSALVGVNDTQTLNNKTLSSPTITGTVGGSANYTSPTISGTVGGAATYTNPTVSPASSSGIGLIVKGQPSQSADLQRWVDSTNTLLSAVDFAGIPHFFPGLQAGFLNQWQVDNGGNLVSAGNITAGAWNTFTPVWTATSVNPTLGNGTLSGRWSRVGRTIHYQGLLICGSTTNGGSGLWSMSLPVAPANSNGMFQIGTSDYANIGDNEYLGTCFIDLGGSVVGFIVKGQASYFSVNVSNTAPVNTNANVRLRWSITYESAS